MPYRKLKHRVQRSNTHQGYRISRRPVICIDADERLTHTEQIIELPHERGARILFAIARDSRTICATWNIDWPSLFETVVPVDRKVHLRVYGADGIEEKTVAVEPMAAMHYVTTSGPHAWYRVEIGYYQSADVWHSVAVSEAIMMPPIGISETADIDLVTIPFHVAFQQLVDLFGSTNNNGLARAIAQFQNGALAIEQTQREPSAHQKRILRRLRSSVSELAVARRAVDQIKSVKLTRRIVSLVRSESTSPSRRFYPEWASAGS